MTLLEHISVQDSSEYSSANFTSNLRLACSYYPSVSEVCRKIQINRQQFNKYVSGKSFPSRATLRRICDFVGVDEFEILMPSDQFRQIVQLRPRRTGDSPPIPEAVDALFLKAQRQKGYLGRYIGNYFAYYASLSRPGHILRSLVQIASWHDFVVYRRIERLIDANGGPPDVYKYTGMVVEVRDRLHLIDQETLTGSELTHTILFPVYRNRVSHLTGLTIGVSGADTRRPSATRIVLEYIGRNARTRESLRRCGLLASGSDQVPDVVSAYLRDPAGELDRPMQAEPLSP
ncbi:helix-turn-helix domain-containing protein [Paracoccus benzoatiresistens]|uniref:Helix-turn-helix transcriptional regulator n=1 Tax=Paracoccus benzoatiresistens TaxID=2997341 RepID=A0ABT4J7K8_9RHOB|nr:helix-turn-helix transcriptional regulator [Paracoccus sp. EF6]MCZ0962562.1 helix-turn-helix transcriptional regulator [Paracoccus sp. EF6]